MVEFTLIVFAIVFAGAVALGVWMVRGTFQERRFKRRHKHRAAIYRIRESAAKRERNRMFKRARQIDYALKHQIAGVN